MTVEELKAKYPDFRYGNEHVFTINKDPKTKEFTNITLTLSCDIKELLSDENFIDWLDETWANEKKNEIQ